MVNLEFISLQEIMEAVLYALVLAMLIELKDHILILVIHLFTKVGLEVLMLHFCKLMVLFIWFSKMMVMEINPNFLLTSGLLN